MVRGMTGIRMKQPSNPNLCLATLKLTKIWQSQFSRNWETPNEPFQRTRATRRLGVFKFCGVARGAERGR
jgi:hypothetical protein